MWNEISFATNEWQKARRYPIEEARAPSGGPISQLSLKWMVKVRLLQVFEAVCEYKLTDQELNCLPLICFDKDTRYMNRNEPYTQLTYV